MPNLRQLEYLVAIAETRHFRRAAERANTSQPTLSEQLKALEERLGAQLVERSRTRVVLTPLGEQVVEISRRMLADANEIRALAQSGGRELSGVLRIGLPSTVGPYLLPRALEDGRHDVIISLMPVKGSELQSEPLYREPLHLAVASDHPFGRKSTIRRDDLQGLDVLTLGPGYQLHSVVRTLCEELGAKLRLDYEGTSLDTLREMVAMGLGVTFLPGLYVRSVASRDPSIRIVNFEGRTIYRTVGMAWRRASARRESYMALARLIKDVAHREIEEISALV